MSWLVGISWATDVALHSANHSHPSRFQVFEDNVKKASASGMAFPDYEVRKVYTIDGKELLFATAALVYQNWLLLGTVAHNMLLCQLIH